MLPTTSRRGRGTAVPPYSSCHQAESSGTLVGLRRGRSAARNIQGSVAATTALSITACHNQSHENNEVAAVTLPTPAHRSQPAITSTSATSGRNLKAPIQPKGKTIVANQTLLSRSVTEGATGISTNSEPNLPTTPRPGNEDIRNSPATVASGRAFATHADVHRNQGTSDPSHLRPTTSKIPILVRRNYTTDVRNPIY